MMKKIISICLLALAITACDSKVVKEVSTSTKSYTITEIVVPVHPAMSTAAVSIVDAESDRVHTESVARSCMANYRVGDHIELKEGLFSSVNKNGEATYAYKIVGANGSFCKSASTHG